MNRIIKELFLQSIFKQNEIQQANIIYQIHITLIADMYKQKAPETKYQTQKEQSQLRSAKKQKSQKEQINHQNYKVDKQELDNPNQSNNQDNNEESQTKNQKKQGQKHKNNRKDKAFQKPIVNVTDQLVYSMFVKANIKKQLVFDLAHDFKNRALRRPFKEMIERLLSNNQNLKKSAYNSHQIIKNLTNFQTNMPRQILQRYLTILIQHKEKIKKQFFYQKVDKMYKDVPTEYLVNFIILYDIPVKNEIQLRDILHELIGKDLCQDAFKLLKSTKLKLDYEKQEKKILQKLIDKKQYKDLRRILKQNKIAQNTIKTLKTQMLNKTARYFLHSQGWQYLEEIFEFHPQTIAFIINQESQDLRRLRKNDNLKGVASICFRNKQVMNKLNKYAKSIIEVEQESMAKQQTWLKNKIIVHHFKPSDQMYFSFEQFGLLQEHICWIDEDTPQNILKQVRKKIQSAQFIGIDTESTVARTPIDTDQQMLALIQVSIKDEVFLFDPFKINHSEIHECFNTYFENKDKTIVGHTIQDDIGLIVKILKVKKNPQCKVIDIRDQVAKMKVKCHQGLKSISHHYLGKEICKKYTLTNWQRRPLNKNQIHYAALDAFIVLKIWEKIVQQKSQKKQEEQKLIQQNEKTSEKFQQNKNQQQRQK